METALTPSAWPSSTSCQLNYTMDPNGSSLLFLILFLTSSGDQKAGTLTRGPDKARGYEVDFLPSGIHILGNNAPGVTWRKVEESRKRFEDIVQQAAPLNDRRLLLDKLIQLLTNRER